MASLATDMWICLMYHDVTEAAHRPAGASEYFSVRRDAFERQLSLIAERGLRGCSIADAIANPLGAVAISFDDGALGQAAHAFPVLMQLDMTATIFVTTGWVGTPGYVSWEQLREMQASGISIQSHTHTHPFLSELPEPALRDELRRSRDLLDETLQQRTTMLALPGGDAPRADLRRIIREEGYRVVATSRWGRNADGAASDPRYVKRCTVRGDPSREEFLRTITGSRSLTLRKQVREELLGFVRASVGPSRYARWRRAVLGGVAPG